MLRELRPGEASGSANIPELVGRELGPAPQQALLSQGQTASPGLSARPSVTPALCVGRWAL